MLPTENQKSACLQLAMGRRGKSTQEEGGLGLEVSLGVLGHCPLPAPLSSPACTSPLQSSPDMYPLPAPLDKAEIQPHFSKIVLMVKESKKINQQNITRNQVIQFTHIVYPSLVRDTYGEVSLPGCPAASMYQRSHLAPAILEGSCDSPHQRWPIQSQHVFPRLLMTDITNQPQLSPSLSTDLDSVLQVSATRQPKLNQIVSPALDSSRSLSKRPESQESQKIPFPA